MVLQGTGVIGEQRGEGRGFNMCAATVLGGVVTGGSDCS